MIICEKYNSVLLLDQKGESEVEAVTVGEGKE